MVEGRDKRQAGSVLRDTLPVRSRGSRALPELSMVTLIRARGASPGQGQEKQPENMSLPVTLAPEYYCAKM